MMSQEVTSFNLTLLKHWVLSNVNVQYQTQVVSNVEPYQASYVLRPNLVESPIFTFMRRFQLFEYDTSREE